MLRILYRATLPPKHVLDSAVWLNSCCNPSPGTSKADPTCLGRSTNSMATNTATGEIEAGCGHQSCKHPRTILGHLARPVDGQPLVQHSSTPHSMLMRPTPEPTASNEHMLAGIILGANHEPATALKRLARRDWRSRRHMP